LARRWKVATNFGYVLDGVADRSAHIALVVALTSRNDLSPVLGYLLIFREILLYAARALFETWWVSNTGFRLRVRLTAVLFKLTVGSLALLSYINDVAPQTLAPGLTQPIQAILRSATWAFAVWSYALLVQQVRRYASATAESRGSR
jgi:phosphatidylglycerophosphate synthase